MTTGTAFVLTFCAAIVFIAVIGIARSAYLLKEMRRPNRRAFSLAPEEQPADTPAVDD